jgi:hypothetical protein
MAFERYEAGWRALFGATLERAAQKRRELDMAWATAACDPAAFERLMREHWVGFPEYYRPSGGDGQ